MIKKTKEERLALRRAYQDAYRIRMREERANRIKRKINSIVDPRYIAMVINPIPKELEQCFFKGDIEHVCCSVWGCGRTLTPTELLFGNKCINHSIKE